MNERDNPTLPLSSAVVRGRPVPDAIVATSQGAILRAALTLQTAPG